MALVALTLGVSACGGPNVERTIPENWIATPYARLSTYFRSSWGEEHTPGDIRHDVIRDEATLALHTPENICFDVVVRTGSRTDEPLEELSPMCKAGRREAEGLVLNELVSIYDIPYGSTRDVMSANAGSSSSGASATSAPGFARAENVSQDSFFNMHITEPTTEVFRVIQRTGRICCYISNRREVGLVLENKSMGVTSSGHAEFAWHVR